MVVDLPARGHVEVHLNVAGVSHLGLGHVLIVRLCLARLQVDVRDEGVSEAARGGPTLALVTQVVVLLKVLHQVGVLAESG